MNGLTSIKAGLRRRYGLYRILEIRNKALLWPSAARSYCIETREVRRLRRLLPVLPSARVVTVIATYRRPEHLLRAVTSALAQTYAEHSVVVVDDGGGMPPLPDDSRLVAISLARNVGVAGVVRNVGIRLSQSTFVAFLDDDNEWEPQHLETAITSAGPQTRVVYTAMTRYLEDGRPVDVVSHPFDRKALADSGSAVDTSTLVVRRGTGIHFSRITRTRTTLPGEDWELVMRLSRSGLVEHVAIPTVRYLVNPKSHFSAWSPDVLNFSSPQAPGVQGDRM